MDHKKINQLMLLLSAELISLEDYETFKDWFSQGSELDRFYAAEFYRENGFIKLWTWAKEL